MGVGRLVCVAVASGVGVAAVGVGTTAGVAVEPVVGVGVASGAFALFVQPVSVVAITAAVNIIAAQVRIEAFLVIRICLTIPFCILSEPMANL